jgi:hypothetical protein
VTTLWKKRQSNYCTSLRRACVSMCCSAWPHSWNSVSTSRKVIRLGWPPIGGVWLHTCGGGAQVNKVGPAQGGGAGSYEPTCRNAVADLPAADHAWHGC